MRMRTIDEVLQEGKFRLKAAGKENHALEAEWLLAEVLGLERVQLFLQGELPMEQEDFIERYRELISQREKNRPLQYILGHCAFMGLQFFVGEGVLVPRADTEVLVETVLETAKTHGLKTFVDVGTGSGCIALSLAHHGVLSGFGLDISTKALFYAKKNKEALGIEEITFFESDLFSALPQNLCGHIDMIVSNPPYIETQVIDGLMQEVKDYEPLSALDGGDDGLDFYREIIFRGRNWLKYKGWLFFEIGYNQGEAVCALMEENGFSEIMLKQDLAGKDRVVFGRKLDEEV